MTELTTRANTTRLNRVQITLGVSGLFYTLTGLALLLMPTWFFTYIGNFSPFNRHYMGDAGAFALALGIGLLIAIRQPEAHRSLILITAVASLIHALNHAYDDWLVRSPLTHWFYETIPLLIFAFVLFLVYRRVSQQ